MKAEYEGWELNYFDSANNFRQYQFNLILDSINGDVAEVGPGTGKNIKYYIQKVKKLHLFEPSNQLYKFIEKEHSQNGKIKIFNKNFLDQNDKFDTIIYLDVLEHIKEDEKEFLNAYNNLNEGGHLIINVPAFNFLFSKFDEEVNHFRRYSKNDFKKFIRLTNASSSKLIYYDSIGFLLIFFSKKLITLKKNNMKNNIKMWNSLIPLSKFLDKIIFHSFGKSLMCVLKK